MSETRPQTPDVPEGAVTEENVAQQPPVMPQLTENQQQAQSSETQSSAGGKSLKEVAEEVIDNQWGKGQERRKRLSEAGYNAHDVQKEVVRIINKL